MVGVNGQPFGVHAICIALRWNETSLQSQYTSCLVLMQSKLISSVALLIVACRSLVANDTGNIDILALSLSCLAQSKYKCCLVRLYIVRFLCLPYRLPYRLT